MCKADQIPKTSFKGVCCCLCFPLFFLFVGAHNVAPHGAIGHSARRPIYKSENLFCGSYCPLRTFNRIVGSFFKVYPAAAGQPVRRPQRKDRQISCPLTAEGFYNTNCEGRKDEEEEGEDLKRSNGKRKSFKSLRRPQPIWSNPSMIKQLRCFTRRRQKSEWSITVWTVT